MATVPGPDPDRPLPKPGAPGLEPPHEPDEYEDPQRGDQPPEWLPKPYDPEREPEETGVPISVGGD